MWFYYIEVPDNIRSSTGKPEALVFLFFYDAKLEDIAEMSIESEGCHYGVVGWLLHRL